MTLAKQIEAMRQRMNEAHEREMELINDLDRSLYAHDSVLRAELERITIEADQRRAGIVRALETLATRVGHYPSIEVAEQMPPPARRLHQHLPN